MPASATSLGVQSETSLPRSGSYRLRVGGELMQVTGGQGTRTLTVQRGGKTFDVKVGLNGKTG